MSPVWAVEFVALGLGLFVVVVALLEAEGEADGAAA